MQSFLLLVSKGIGMVVETDDVEALREDLYQDYIINWELSSTGNCLWPAILRCAAVDC